MREQPEQPPSPEGLPKSVELARLLEHTDDSKEVQEHLGELLVSIETDIGQPLTSDVSAIYKDMYERQCLARIEQLSRVLESIELHKPLAISDEHESHYANAIVPTTEGLHIAFSEGQAPGPVRAVVGFGKTLVGFKTDRIKVEKIDFSETVVNNAEERRFLCRHVSGILDSNDIRHMVLRMPSALVPEHVLTEDERKKKRDFIFRGMQL